MRADVESLRAALDLARAKFRDRSLFVWSEKARVFDGSAYQTLDRWVVSDARPVGPAKNFFRVTGRQVMIVTEVLVAEYYDDELLDSPGSREKIEESSRAFQAMVESMRRRPISHD